MAPTQVGGLDETEEDRLLWSYYFPNDEPTEQHAALNIELLRYASSEPARAHTPERVLHSGCAVPVQYSELVATCAALPLKLERKPHLVLPLLHLVVHRLLLAHPCLPPAGVCKYLSKRPAPDTVSRTPSGTHCTRC
jgi:hypothetical protein